MKKRTASLALVTTLGLGAGLVITPALADTAPGQRVTKIKDALSGLVKDGTLTQAQADKVATTLDQQLPKRGPERTGPGGPGHGFGFGTRHGGPLEDAATALGVTREELRTALESGKSLAEVAAGKGTSRADLVAALLAPLKTKLAAGVKDGRLTQAQADARLAEATTRVGELVDRKGLPPRGGRFEGDGPHGGPGAEPGEPAAPGSLQG